MTQNIVNFLVANYNTSGTLVSSMPDPRIFDFYVSTLGQSQYTQLMTTVQSDITSLSSGFSASTAQDLDKTLQTLDNWSKMISEQTVVDNTDPSNPQTVTQQKEDFSLFPMPVPFPTNLGFTQTDLQDYEQGMQIDPAVATKIQNTVTTMDQYMAQSVSTIINTLRAAGWDPIAQSLTGSSVDPNSLTAAQNAFNAIASNPSLYGFNTLIAQAFSAASQAHIVDDATTGSSSLQQLLMVDYVASGNEILSDQMSQLQQAINLNQNALQYLNSLQDLMNQKDPQQFVLQLASLGTSSTGFNYTQFEQDTFNQQLQAISRLSNDGSLGQYLQSLGPNAIASGVGDQLMQDPITGQTVTIASVVGNVASAALTRITTNLQYIIDQTNAIAPSDGSSLVAAIQTIKSDFTSLSSTSQNPIVSWIQDNQQGQAGNYQTHLNNAITASQSLNDTQRENLSRVMFVFEEFYKSATGLLDSITQLIQKMADFIAR